MQFFNRRRHKQEAKSIGFKEFEIPIFTQLFRLIFSKKSYFRLLWQLARNGNPKPLFRFLLDGMYFIITLYYLIEIPLFMVFDIRHIYLFIVEPLLIALMVIYLIGMAITCGSCYFYQGAMIIDIIVTLPLDLIFYILMFAIPSAADSLAIPFKVCRAFKYLRLLRVSNLFNHSEVYLKIKINQIAGIIKLLLYLFTIVYVFTAIFIVIDTNDYDDNVSQFIASLYFVIYMTSTIGVGDITIKSNVQRLYCIFLMIVGVAWYGIVIGSVSLLLFRNDVVDQQFSSRQLELISILNYYGVPEKDQEVILQYYNKNFIRSALTDYSTVIRHLPSSMQDLISLFMKIKLLNSFSLFRGLDQAALKDIAKDINLINTEPHQMIIKYNSIGRGMYFIVHGEVEVMTKEMDHVVFLNSGFFGEIALFYDVKRTANIRSHTHCTLLRLSKKSLMPFVAKYPTLKANFTREVAARVGIKSKTDTKNLPDFQNIDFSSPVLPASVTDLDSDGNGSFFFQQQSKKQPHQHGNSLFENDPLPPMMGTHVDSDDAITTDVEMLDIDDDQ